MTIDQGEGPSVPEPGMSERLSESAVGSKALNGAIAVELYSKDVPLGPNWAAPLKEVVTALHYIATHPAAKLDAYSSAGIVSPIVEKWLSEQGIDGETQATETLKDFCAIMRDTARGVLESEIARNDPRLAILHQVLHFVNTEISHRYGQDRFGA